jgi:hypothetical protein
VIRRFARQCKDRHRDRTYNRQRFAEAKMALPSLTLVASGLLIA